MRRGALLGLAVVPWLVTAGFRFHQRVDPADWDAIQWSMWRDGQVKRILEPGADGQILPRHQVIQRCGEAYAFLAPYLQRPDAARDRALGNFLKFITAERRLELTDEDGNITHGLGMEVTDADYWRFVSPYVKFPTLLQSQEFLEAMRDRSYQSAIQMIEEKNKALPTDRKWVVYPYKSQFILSVDELTYGRLLILVPNEPMPGGRLLDRWIQFAATTPDQQPPPKVASVSVIGVVHDRLPSPSTQAYLADFMRQTDPANGEISIKSNFLMHPNPSKVCIDCHKTAVIPIHPGTPYGFDENGNLKPTDDPGPVPAQLNYLIESYGKTDFGRADPDAYGPSLGVAKPVSDDFIAAATDLPLSSYPNVRAAMGCAKCHDSFAKINYLPAVQTDRDAKAFQSKEGMVRTYIENGWMPPDNHLSDDERHALWQCVMKAYFDPKTTSGTFVDWLRGR